MNQKLKFGLFGLLGCWLIYSLFFKGDSSSSTTMETTTEEVLIPTQGLITVLQEVEKDQFKIEDEQVIADTAASLIIAKYLDNTSDTFTLAEARLMESGNGSTQNTTRSGGGIMRAASYGLMGYFLGRSMSSGPSPGAYVDQRTYDKVNNSAGSQIRQTAGTRTVTRTRPTTGKSGYGGGRSTRSVGG